MLNLYISNNLSLNFNNILYRSLIKLFGINKYKIKVILTLSNMYIYKKYKNINFLNYFYLKNIFNYITFNINIFKKKNIMYYKKKYHNINKNENKVFYKKNL